jgi:hypothetical protein
MQRHNHWLTGLLLTGLACSPVALSKTIATKPQATPAASTAKVATSAPKLLQQTLTSTAAATAAQPAATPAQAAPTAPKTVPSAKPPAATTSNPSSGKVAELPKSAQMQLAKLYESVHFEDKQIANTMADEQEEALTDISMLWRSAVERSTTIRYAIENLSRRDLTGKPVSNDNFTRKMITSLAHLGGVAGSIFTGSPASMMSSQLVDQIVAEDPSKVMQHRVTDADMLILAREVEALQGQVIDAYYTYRFAREREELAQKAFIELSRLNNVPLDVQSNNPVLMESLLDSAKLQVTSAKQQTQSARNNLAMISGPEAVVALEKLHSVAVQD